MSNPSDETGKEPNLGNDPPKVEVTTDDLPSEDPKGTEEESQDPSLEVHIFI